MKKKLLSLVLAGAMVATTSVSAFAEESKTYEFTSGSVDHQVTVTGDVQNEHGDVVAGTITVTVPTTMAFTITNDGTVDGGAIEVVNRSKDPVEVVAKKFTDNTPDSKIILVKESELNTKIQEHGSDENNRYISLTLRGNGGEVGLVSDSRVSDTGFIDEKEEKISAEKNKSLGNAWENNNLRLELTGRAKRNDADVEYDAPSVAIQDKFNLVLKIQKTK